jgi:hypothetical protein
MELLLFTFNIACSRVLGISKTELKKNNFLKCNQSLKLKE